MFCNIHLVCLQKDARPLFIHEIFAHLLKYLLFAKAHDRIHAITQLAALYAMYLVYITQPTSSQAVKFKRYPIRLPIRKCPQFSSTLTSLELLSSNAKSIIEHLRRLNAFVVVAYDELIDELVLYMHEFDNAGVFPAADGLSELRHSESLDNMDAVERKLVASWSSAESKSALDQLQNHNMATSTSMSEYMQAKIEAMEYHSNDNGIGMVSKQFCFDPHSAPHVIDAAIKKMQTEFQNTFMNIQNGTRSTDLASDAAGDGLGLPSFDDMITLTQPTFGTQETWHQHFDPKNEDEDIEASYKDLMDYLDTVNR